MTITVSPVPILRDNYAWLLRDSGTGATAIVDPAEAEPVIEALEKAGGRLDTIFLTHHHADHIDGVDEVRARFHCTVVGAAADRHRLPALDEAVKEGDTVRLGDAVGQVIETPGHTRGQINFFFPDGAVLVKEVTKVGSERLTAGEAHWSTDPKLWFVLVKDANKRFPGNDLWGDGWGWGLFLANLKVWHVRYSP